ncbi:cardiolipin synthase ClsB [Buttiauxella sp. 3AFRM03]|uniref:cardiolipin synthase ClsB n=1 Tax=Buttiauxella sp. 3AFRM03 TaxID=2479367 RepID=UPI000EF84130|nr:cardiolipin synthase ClsB [Buttiauxella sp. 3AFRM03]AYN26977.1 cardiolipin synthase ClsB [Buttiauxella sp. 3AFRM03]
MKNSWRDGNCISLLENGDQFFPAVFTAISQARSKVLLETFIWFEDDVGKQLHAVLLNAAQRGVRVEVLLDGYGSPDLSDEFVSELTSAGVMFRYYDPRPPLFGIRTNLFRRMHRKIVVVDSAVAFVGGINYSAEQMSDYGPEAKQDYSVKVEGPVVQDIYQYVVSNLPGHDTKRHWWHRRRNPAQENLKPGEAQALFVWRDNNRHRDDIERYYLKMLGKAKREVIIANAYFFPGYRLLHAMRNASRRGVSVKLIVQGEPDMPIVKVGARLLYNYLVRSGVKIYEYQRRPLHGKVALMDDHWATVGSSNLDPLSLSLNLEANLIIYDRTFNETLRQNLSCLIAQDCQPVDESMLPKRTWWNLGKSVLAFHFLRHFPAMVGWLPAHTPKLAQVMPPAQPQLETQDRIDAEVEAENPGVKY